MFDYEDRSDICKDMYKGGLYVGEFYFNKHTSEWIFVSMRSFNATEHRQIADKLDELNVVKVSEPQFVMSMYANRQDLLEHKAAYYENMYEKLRRMSPGEFKKLVDQKVWEGKDFDELVAAWPENI